jgi:hypothetical protein
MFHQCGSIDMLIGADTFYEILLPNRRTRPGNYPVLQQTELGWTVSGKTPVLATSSDIQSSTLARQSNIQPTMGEANKHETSQLYNGNKPHTVTQRRNMGPTYGQTTLTCKTNSCSFKRQATQLDTSTGIKAARSQQHSEVPVYEHMGIQRWSTFMGISKEVREFNLKLQQQCFSVNRL